MVEAPEGTISLVFTDIEASTTFWEQFGNNFQSVLALHDSIVRTTLYEFEGYEVKTEGGDVLVKI